MNRYDETFKSIIKKYFPNENVNENINVIDLIGKVIEENKGSNFAIWGAGEHTENLHKYFSIEMKDVKCIIDNNEKLWGTKFLGFDVVNPEDIGKINLKTIFISSYGGRLDMKKQAKKLLPNCKIVDFYEILEEKGIKLNGPFYIYEGIYMELYKFIMKYKNSNNELKRQLYLKKIIFLYLQIRDVYNAKKFIKIYLESNYEDSNFFKSLFLDIENLMNRLSTKLKERSGEDILLLFFDSLRSKDVFNSDSSMEYLNNVLSNSKYFTNAFSPSITTYESVPSILIGKPPFSDKLYEKKLVDENEVTFIKKAIDSGYNIKIYTVDYWKIIEGRNITYGEYSNFMSENFWNALCDLAENKSEKTIYLLYFLSETHPPHICGYHTVSPVRHNTPFTCNDIVKQSQQQYNIQYEDCLKYLDNQLECYFEIMGDDITKVIFSDHGQIIEEAMSDLKCIGTLAGWHDDRYHIPLIISGSKVKSSKCNDIFSMIDFNNLIISLIDNKEYINNQKYIEVNFSKISNATIKKKYLETGDEDYLYGFKVLRDDKYKLVITGNGKYKVYILPEQFKECTDEEIRENVIRYFGEIADISIPKL